MDSIAGFYQLAGVCDACLIQLMMASGKMLNKKRKKQGEFVPF
jgi:hypothetical protein